MKAFNAHRSREDLFACEEAGLYLNPELRGKVELLANVSEFEALVRQFAEGTAPLLGRYEFLVALNWLTIP